MWIDPLSKRLFNGAGLVPSSKGRGPVVLMYHSISSGSHVPESIWSVSEKGFREQLRLLAAEGWKTACVRDLVRPEKLPPRTVVITFDDGYADNFERGFKHLLKLNMKATWFMVSGDVGRRSSWKDENSPGHSMLSSMELREMNSAGMEIGAHTRTHARLTEIEPSRVVEEVRGSKTDIEDVIGEEVESFAYPYGLFDEGSVGAVRNAGFKAACTTRTGWSGSSVDLLRIRRVAVFSGDRLSVFARKLAFADNDVAWGRMTNYVVSRARQRFFGR